MFTRTSVLVISTVLMLTACSSSSDETSTPAASQSSDSAPALTGTPVSVEVTGEAGSEPVVAITPGDPVTELQVTDVIVGEGDAVQAGATVTAHYVGYGAATGQMFDSSWVRGEPATFPLPNSFIN